MNANNVETNVLIVGAGPVGLFLANEHLLLVRRFGCKRLTNERCAVRFREVGHTSRIHFRRDGDTGAARH
jgi:2-polyprenyl-6-methoxyphenol hydroxylase-like FAD-dependent oxidoreductase